MVKSEKIVSLAKKVRPTKKISRKCQDRLKTPTEEKIHNMPRSRYRIFPRD